MKFVFFATTYAVTYWDDFKEDCDIRTCKKDYFFFN